MLAAKFLSTKISWRLYSRRTFIINDIKKYFSHGTTGSETIFNSIYKIHLKSKSNNEREEGKGKKKPKYNLKN